MVEVWCLCVVGLLLLFLILVLQVLNHDILEVLQDFGSSVNVNSGLDRISEGALELVVALSGVRLGKFLEHPILG